MPLVLLSRQRHHQLRFHADIVTVCHDRLSDDIALRAMLSVLWFSLMLSIIVAIMHFDAFVYAIDAFPDMLSPAISCFLRDIAFCLPR